MRAPGSSWHTITSALAPRTDPDPSSGSKRLYNLYSPLPASRYLLGLNAPVPRGLATAHAQIAHLGQSTRCSGNAPGPRKAKKEISTVNLRHWLLTKLLLLMK